LEISVLKEGQQSHHCKIAIVSFWILFHWL